MDYTLIQYDTISWEGLAVSCAAQHWLICQLLSITDMHFLVGIMDDG